MQSVSIFDRRTTICAGVGTGKDTCAGNSGGALAFFSKGRWKIAGVVRFGGYPCGVFGAFSKSLLDLFGSLFEL